MPAGKGRCFVLRRTVLYVFKLGPVPTTEGKFNVHVGVTEAGVVPAVFGKPDGEALAELKSCVYGEPLFCEKRLVKAGRPLGFKAAPMPEFALQPRAMLALSLANSRLDAKDTDVIEMLIGACATFVDTRVWERFSDDEPVRVTVSGALEASFEASIMGGAGFEYGLALYFKDGAMNRVAEAMGRRDMDAARLEDCLAVTLDDKPRFAVKAIVEAFGLGAVPVAYRVRDGQLDMPSRAEMLALGAAVRAVAELSPEHPVVSIEGGTEDLQIVAQAEAPAIALTSA
jgi:hypothetical protein